MPSDPLPPASAGNRARQTRSRLNITHPVQWDDAALEQSYNVDRAHRDKVAELKRLHRPDVGDCGGGNCDCGREVDADLAG